MAVASGSDAYDHSFQALASEPPLLSTHDTERRLSSASFIEYARCVTPRSEHETGYTSSRCSGE